MSSSQAGETSMVTTRRAWRMLAWIWGYRGSASAAGWRATKASTLSEKRVMLSDETVGSISDSAWYWRSSTKLGSSCSHEVNSAGRRIVKNKRERNSLRKVLKINALPPLLTDRGLGAYPWVGSAWGCEGDGRVVLSLPFRFYFDCKSNKKFWCRQILEQRTQWNARISIDESWQNFMKNLAKKMGWMFGILDNFS